MCKCTHIGRKRCIGLAAAEYLQCLDQASDDLVKAADGQKLIDAVKRSDSEARLPSLLINMAAASATKASQRSRAPFVNLFDLPELMPGAQPSANPAQREEFENRCRQLHRDEEQERQDRLEKAYEQRAAAAPDLTSTSELEAMFPTLDAELVRSIHAEAQTPQDAVDTLLALTLAAEPLEALPTLPPREVGMDDHDKFPALTDAEGWQVANQKLFDRDPEEDLGSAWRDRAKAAQDMPAPKAAVAPAKPRSGPAKAKKEDADENAEPERKVSPSKREAETNITKILRLIDSDMVDDTPGAVNALTRKGLILRDAFFRSAATSPKAMMKRKVAEHYMLSAIHAFSCSVFSLRKLLSNRWTSAVGSEAMLCFSLGYTSYTLLALRSQLFSDPLFAVNELANFVKHWSCLRAQGTGWIVPLLLSAEIPTACLDLLRMLAEVGLSPSGLAWRFCLLAAWVCLGAFTTSFVAVKGLLLPICLGAVIARPRQYPELHQPAFLPAKLAMLVRVVMSYTWLSIVARHWVPTRHLHPEGYLVSPSAQLPAILYALARKPGPPDQQAQDLQGALVARYRLAAGSALLGLGVLAVPRLQIHETCTGAPEANASLAGLGEAP
ncbi:hypothetical protein AK812_SmicGene31726 [Symbiodinium microadriaticum]|uniref:CUE domain-containing protein n=1 Tax=Symbiodinium microadriaticum TaxID=2951 RepID=A0A1Q9CVZ4_SYMMI|nr:hypothetical protein AK812_SmicGene31726 [Symbiodinium microadriaticum]